MEEFLKHALTASSTVLTKERFALGKEQLCLKEKVPMRALAASYQISDNTDMDADMVL